MSQRVHRILVVCVALVGCDAPAAKREPAPVQAVAAPAPRPAEKAPPPPAPIEAAEPAEAPPPPPPPAKVTPELKQALGRSINQLTIDLQRKLARQPGNLFVSGMSVSVALAMLSAGSGGATAKELAKVLHLERPTDEALAAFAGLAARWNHPQKNVTLVSTSRLFGEQKFGFKPDYLELTRAVFAAPLEPLDVLADPAAARERINAWVRERTGDKIGEIAPADAIDANTRLFLADAAYFKADWLEPFDVSATTPQMFHGVEQKRAVPMMRSVQPLRVALGLSGKLRVLELPYKGGEYSMVILLPAKRDGLKEIEKQFDADRLQSWLDAAKLTSVELTLPRFTLDSSVDLAPALQKLGASRVFDRKRADLSAMATEKKLALSAVRHRAQITVEERGAEVDAAPAIEVSVGGARTSPVPFIVDRPFLFYIRDVRTGVLLFFGRVTDPA